MKFKLNTIKILAAAIACTAVVSTFTSCGNQSSYVASSQYEIYKLEKQSLEKYISVSGNVEGSNVVNVTSNLGTKIKKLNVELGSNVKAGDVLCEFDSSDFQVEYDSLKSSSDKTSEKAKNDHEINLRNLEKAKVEKSAALVQAQRVIDNATAARDKAYQKYSDLKGTVDANAAKCDELKNALSSAENYDSAYQDYQSAVQMYESSKTEYSTLGDQLSTYDNAIQDAKDAYDTASRNADTAVQTAQDAIDSEKFATDDTTKTQLDKLQEKISKCVVKAPKDGIITALSVTEGSIPTTDAIMTIEDATDLKIKATINEADILNLHDGMKAVIKTAATGDTEFSGTVSRVVNIFSGAKNNAVTGETTGGGYSAQINIDSSDKNELLIGMNAKVKIITEEKKDVLAVPYDAIVKEDDGSCKVFVAEDKGNGKYIAKETSVTKGMETNYLTEISSTEIKEGDSIIVSPDGVHNGQSVTIADGYYTASEQSDGE